MSGKLKHRREHTFVFVGVIIMNNKNREITWKKISFYFLVYQTQELNVNRSQPGLNLATLIREG